LVRVGARLACLVALLSVFGGCWASSGSAALGLSCAPVGATVLVSDRAVGRCGDGLVGVAAGLQTVEVRASGRLPLRVEILFEPWEQYELGGALESAVSGLDDVGAGSGLP
jgi:hypothetical protein